MRSAPQARGCHQTLLVDDRSQGIDDASLKRTQTGSETTYEAARSAPLSVIASERSAAASRRRRLELVDDQSASSQSESVPPGPSTHVNSRARDFRPTHRQSFDDDAFETLRRNIGSAPEFRASCPLRCWKRKRPRNSKAFRRWDGLCSTYRLGRLFLHYLRSHGLDHGADLNRVRLGGLGHFANISNYHRHHKSCFNKPGRRSLLSWRHECLDRLLIAPQRTRCTHKPTRPPRATPATSSIRPC